MVSYDKQSVLEGTREFHLVTFIMWWALENHKVPSKYITLIKNMYDIVLTSVRISDVDTDDFPIKIGLHQGSALSPYLFCIGDG